MSNTALTTIDDRIHRSGQHIALVVAETSAQARHAAGLVRARYEEDAHPALRLGYSEQRGKLCHAAYSPRTTTVVPSRTLS